MRRRRRRMFVRVKLHGKLAKRALDVRFIRGDREPELAQSTPTHVGRDVQKT